MNKYFVTKIKPNLIWELVLDMISLSQKRSIDNDLVVGEQKMDNGEKCECKQI